MEGFKGWRGGWFWVKLEVGELGVRGEKGRVICGIGVVRGKDEKFGKDVLGERGFKVGR